MSAAMSDDQVFLPAAVGDDEVFAHPDISVPAVLGGPASMSTTSGDDIDGRFAVLHAGDVVASHDVNGRENADHQAATGAAPRDRAELEQRVQQIVSDLDPQLLGDSLGADDGAPIVGPDGLVEAGNARAVALQRIQRLPAAKAEQYRAWLMDNAAVFGLDPAEIEAIDRPMLVRVRSTPTDRAGVGRQLSMSSLEPALKGAAKEMASAAREGRELSMGDPGELHPETAATLQFLSEHADSPDTIDAVLTAAKGILDGKPPEDAVGRDHRADEAPGQGAGRQSQAAASDRGSDQGNEAAGPEGVGQPEWEAFGPETGSLGIARENMPQIRQEHRGPLTQFLLARGIPHTQDEVAPETLRPTQSHWSPQKVAGAAERADDDRAALVSSDGFVVDGHHSWLAALAHERPIRVIRFDAPALELLDQVQQFPSAEAAS